MSDALSNGSSEIAALAQQVETARGKLPLQYDPALLDVLSEGEIAAERELAEWIRAQRRKQRRGEIEAELAAQRRDRKSAAALRRADEADARWHRRALAARRRVSSEDARLAQLYRRAEWSSRVLIAVVVLGMVWAGVNVQHNLVPSGDMSDPLYWLSYGIEAMISIPIITIMVAATTAARWGRELARGKVIFFEAALLGTTVALNTGPHLAAGDFGRAAEYAIAPVMVGVVIWLHAWVSARYAVLIDGAPVLERDAPMIRVDAEHVAAESGRHPLDNRDDPADGGRFRRDGGSPAPRLSGVGTTDSSTGPRDRLRGRGLDSSVNAHPGVPGAPAAALGVYTERDMPASSTTPNQPTETPADEAKPSPSDGHLTDRRTNGHSVDEHDAVGGYPLPPTTHAARAVHQAPAPTTRSDGQRLSLDVAPLANGHAFPTVTTSADVHAHNHPVNGHAVPTDATGHTACTTHNHPDGEIRETSTTSGRADGRSADGYPVADADSRAFPSATDDHTVDTSSHGHASGTRVNGHAPTRNANGHTALPPLDAHDRPANRRPVPPAINGYNTETGTSHAHNLPANIHTAPPALHGHSVENSFTKSRVNNPPPDGYTGPTADSPTSAPAHIESPAPSVGPVQNAMPLSGDRITPSGAADVDTRTIRSADSTATQSFSTDAKHFGSAATSLPAGIADTRNNSAAPAASTSDRSQLIANIPAAQQISIEDLHGEFVFGTQSITAVNNLAAKDPAASQFSLPEPDGRRAERAHRRFDSAGHASTEPARTLPTANTEAAEANPDATGPRAAKRGKSLSTDRGERSADAESEQLSLDESPEPTRPHLRAELKPIPDEDDENDEFPAENDEADTDDDEISAIARAIAGRRMSNLPIEEVREILTLADQGGTTPAIANELGISRSAVTRVLDSAIRVHRPYLVIG
ncbi:hypothetical protein [Nocardia sp. R6R-6]|uniref:hypothetical protein n=1 Tax=Nocardia sp. R6R-6 TaxID=3459303 RepID=UPI00403D65F1